MIFSRAALARKAGEAAESFLTEPQVLSCRILPASWRYLPSSSAMNTIPDPMARKPHKSPTTLLTGTTKPRPTASIVAHIRWRPRTCFPPSTPFIFGYLSTPRRAPIRHKVPTAYLCGTARSNRPLSLPIESVSTPSGFPDLGAGRLGYALRVGCDRLQRVARQRDQVPLALRRQPDDRSRQRALTPGRLPFRWKRIHA